MQIDVFLNKKDRKIETEVNICALQRTKEGRKYFFCLKLRWRYKDCEWEKQREIILERGRGREDSLYII